ncbi:MAG: ABC transporter ATP-binding protein [Thermoplasmata archaeon]|nr:ABC transporter ATP-binding protein [Thermoplasmata archaeon]
MSASRPVEVEDLSVRFGARSALSRVSWTASAGELVALAGPNGSGKSTLLRACLGLLAPTQGTVRLFGTDCGQLSIRERARRVAWVPQEEAPRDNLRLIEYVLFGRYAHLPPFTGESADDRRTAERALAEAGLADRADSGILELSGGERQRLLLARALAQETPLLLLDEPTAHLDIGHQLDLFERVRRQVRDRGLCAIAAMHDLNLAARFADRILVLSHGRLVSDGPPESVLSVPLLREVWGVETELRRDPHSHRPYLLPLRAAAEGRLSSPADRRLGPVHVVGGGGSASPVLRRLVDEGFHVTAGALPLLDTDADTAAELGIPFSAEVPFAPIGELARVRTQELLSTARAVVIAPVPTGPGNLVNLELVEALGHPERVLWLHRRADLDYTGGRANELAERLLTRGATEVNDLDALVDQLRRVIPAASFPAAVALS